MRSMTERTPNSGAQLDQTAPSAAVARKATMVSGMLGAYAATRSPGPTPARRSPSVAAITCDRNSSHVSVTAGRVWLWAITAGSRARVTVAASARSV
jgi:hypothetical protein